MVIVQERSGAVVCCRRTRSFATCAAGGIGPWQCHPPRSRASCVQCSRRKRLLEKQLQRRACCCWSSSFCCSFRVLVLVRVSGFRATTIIALLVYFSNAQISVFFKYQRQRRDSSSTNFRTALDILLLWHEKLRIFARPVSVRGTQHVPMRHATGRDS